MVRADYEVIRRGADYLKAAELPKVGRSGRSVFSFFGRSFPPPGWAPIALSVLQCALAEPLGRFASAKPTEMV